MAANGIKGILLAALAATCVAVPADARGRHHRHHDDVDAGDVVAGVAIAGGIAAIASAISSNNRARRDAAVEDCADEAENRTRGRVSEIFGVHKSRGYYLVDGVVDLDGGSDSFQCTVRKGRVYSFQTSASES